MDEKVKEGNLSEIAITILKERYLRRDENGNVIETPKDLFRRVAKDIAIADALYEKDKNKKNIEEKVKETEEKFYEIMSELLFLPNSPTLMNAGTKLQQLSACFVLPIEDDMESILETAKRAGIIHKTGGGTGFSFSRLRPKNDIVKSTGGVASGPVSFMKMINAITEEIKQGGKRRGANMGILNVYHPDILEFITCKKVEGEVANFNISVAVDSNFINCVRENKKIPLINPRNGEIVREESARKIFDTIVEMMYRNGEPGVIFIDKINEKNPTPDLGLIEATNPCGEQPLLPYESCNLGSINLSKMVVEKNGGKEIDFEKLKKVTKIAVHFLDNVIDRNNYPYPEIEFLTKGNRKIGLGVMGFADLLIQLKIPYNSEEAILLAEKIMREIQYHAREASRELAEKRGVFPNFEKSIYKNDPNCKFRNATLTTIAPTGTLSLIAGCSSGIEPLYSLVYESHRLDRTFLETNKYFMEELRKRNLYNDQLLKKILKLGSIQKIEEIPEDLKKVFVVARDLTYADHVKIQAAFQKYVDNAVSKTINFPKDCKKEDIEKAIFLAHDLGCKGITVYRDGSRRFQVLKLKEEKIILKKKEAGKIIKGERVMMETGCGKMYININKDNGNPIEVFANMGKAGGCVSAQNESIGRLCSLALRYGIPPSEIIRQLEDICCEKPMGIKEKVKSCADGIAKALKIICEEKDEKIKIENKEGKEGENKEEKKEMIKRKREKIHPGITLRELTGCGNMYITFNFNIDDLSKEEIFISLGKAGGCTSAQTEAIARLISLLFKYNIPSKEITKELGGIRCIYGNSCADVIANAINYIDGLVKRFDKNFLTKAAVYEIYIENEKNKEKEKEENNNRKRNLEICPECGGEIEIGEGCFTCRICGFTKCM